MPSDAAAFETPFRLKHRRVWVAGHRGMVGSALTRRLAREDVELLTAGREQVDLRRQQAVEDWMSEARPEIVFLAAASVGGILAYKTRPAEFLYDNLAIETNVIEAARRVGVAKLVFIGSSCVYPSTVAQPMAEDALLTGPLEPTSEWYAVAKIAGIKLCQAYRRQHGCDFITALPNNLYGPGDDFDLASGHVVAALMRKTHEAKLAGAPSVVIWGSGDPKREFIYVEDMADGAVHLCRRYTGEAHVNIGFGRDVSIRELAATIQDVVGYQGDLAFDARKPDGAVRKLLDVERMQALGWSARTSLRDGLTSTYQWYLDQSADGA